MTTKLKAANLNATYSADQVLKTSAAGALSWAADAGGLFSSYAIIADQKLKTQREALLPVGLGEQET